MILKKLIRELDDSEQHELLSVLMTNAFRKIINQAIVSLSNDMQNLTMPERETYEDVLTFIRAYRSARNQKDLLNDFISIERELYKKFYPEQKLK
jgi:DNA replication initiation complex subunit (GINS family)